MFTLPADKIALSEAVMVMQPKQPLLQKCLHRLAALPHFQARVEVMPYVTESVLADGQLTEVVNANTASTAEASAQKKPV